MKGVRSSLAIVSVIMLLGATVAYAGPWGGGRGAGCGGGAMGGIWGAIWQDLSKEQQQQALSLRTEFLKKAESVRSEIAKKRIQMLEMAAKDTPDEAAMEKVREEIWALSDTLRNERRALGTKMRGLLTPEQKRKFGPMGFGEGFGGFHGGLRAGGGPDL